jgi:hypothetical protein
VTESSPSGSAMAQSDQPRADSTIIIVRVATRQEA